MRFFKLLICLLFLSFGVNAQVISLDGLWQFSIDNEDVGVNESWFKKSFVETIYLPGSMSENLKGNIPDLKTQWTGSLYDSSFYYNPAMEKFRKPGNIKFPFFLTPDRHYIGPAWYSKDVIIPDNWKNTRVVLNLERAHTESRIWVDNKEVGKDSTMCVPHVFDLSQYLTPGKHKLTIRIDNRIKSANVGQDSHSLTDQTQGNWNGVVGKISLNAGSKIYINDIQIFPDLAKRQAKVKVEFANEVSKNAKCLFTFKAKSFNSTSNHETAISSHLIEIPSGKKEFEFLLDLGDGMLTWDEFNPNLYKLEASLTSGNRYKDNKSVQFGMREIKIEGKWFYVNGRKTQLRGTVENCCFPITGYAPMDVDSWIRIFRICKDYGLNHMRFHSYCPPEAAFIAADITGMYLQPEGPSWPNHGSSLGDGKPIDKFLMDETIRLTKQYGNYASYVMLASGNEPRGRWVAWVSKFVNYWKEKDNRRVYTGASVGGSWAWQPANQYHVKAGARGLEWGRMPESFSDFRDKIDTIKAPFVSHETGQWCAFPNFNEIKKYTGVNKAKNFELFKEHLADNDMGDLGHDFMMASGKLQLLCYKHEIEKTMRTPDYAGFQLLSLNDYSGQGTALVGLLDVFWDEKGYCTANDFRKFCGPVVPLIRTEKFVYTNNEHFNAEVELSYFGKNAYQVIKPYWQLKDVYGTVIKTGYFEEKAIETGANIQLGKIDIDLGFVQKAGEYKLEVIVGNTEGKNDWDIYVYPEKLNIEDKGKIIVAYQINDDIAKKLKEGADVLLLAGNSIEYGKDIIQTLTPVFWNTSWFKMRPPHTTGILVNNYHPVFRNFPTNYHADIRWWELMTKTQVMQLTEFPKGFKPLIQTIDTWFHNRKSGLLFEAKVGKGRIMVTSMNLEGNNAGPVARQMLYSITEYMKSTKFRPDFSLDEQVIRNLFRKTADRLNTYTNDSPDELKPSLNQ